jgi:hypothetical protein
MNCASIFACQSLLTNFPYDFVCMSIGFHFKNIIGFCNLNLKANM